MSPHLAGQLPVSGARFRLEPASAGAGTIAVTRLRDGEAVGHIVTKASGPVLTIHSLCIDEAKRGYGAGSEAARLLALAAAAAGFQAVRAHAPAGRGLAVYFWSRMGFRPLHGEGPSGGIWLERQTG